MQRNEFKLPPLLTFADLVLLILIGGSSFALYGFRFWRDRSTGPLPLSAVVRVRNEAVARLALSRDTTLVVSGKVGEITLVVSGGSLHFENASCAQHICEKMGRISRAGEIIVCAPNHVLARVEGEESRRAGSLDAISR